MGNISEYMKAHPWATGIIVVVGGIIFIFIVRGSSGSSSSSNPNGESDAQVAADATIQAAQISAQAQAAAAGAAIQQSQIGAGVQMHSDDLAAQVAMRQLDVQQTLGLDTGVTDRAGIDAEKDVAITQYDDQLKQIQAYVGGQVDQNSSNNKQKNVSGIIGAIGGIVGSIFSDQRLKENITLVGEDKAGRNVYRFNYKGSNQRRLGYIAQDIQRGEPDKVFTDTKTGFLKTTAYPILTSGPAVVPISTIEAPVLTSPFASAHAF